MQIIFIPGLMCTDAVWGQTNKIRDKYKSYDADVFNFESITEMSDALIKTIPSDDIAIIGISMGGYIAIDAALKLGNRLKKLILINTTANSINTSLIDEKLRTIKMVERGLLAEMINVSTGICYYQPKKEWIELERRMAREVGADVYIKQQKAIIHRKNYSDLIKNITTETLIISGKNDKVISYKDSIYLAEKIANSNLFLLGQCGHLATLEKTEIVANSINQFLKI